MIDETVIRSRFEALRPRLDERGRRLFCAAEARSAGYGGVSVVARATGIARSTINRGLKDLQARDLAPSRVRRSGGGRPALLRSDPTLLEDLRDLLESTTLGDPMRPLVWVSKSHRLSYRGELADCDVCDRLPLLQDCSSRSPNAGNVEVHLRRG
jgi:hypothetical protein